MCSMMGCSGSPQPAASSGLSGLPPVPPAPATYQVTVPSQLSLLSLSPRAWFSAACLTRTGPCKLPPLATPLCLLSLLARVQHHLVVFPTCWEHTSRSLMVPRNHPPFYAETDPEYPRPLTHWGGRVGQNSQHSPVALPLMTTVRLRLSRATVPPDGYG